MSTPRTPGIMDVTAEFAGLEHTVVTQLPVERILRQLLDLFADPNSVILRAHWRYATHAFEEERERHTLHLVNNPRVRAALQMVDTPDVARQYVQEYDEASTEPDVCRCGREFAAFGDLGPACADAVVDL